MQMPAEVEGEGRLFHLTDDDMLHDRYKYYNVTYVRSQSGLRTEPKYQLFPELKAMHAWLQADMCLYLTPNAADRFLDLLKYFGKAPPDLNRTQDRYRADFCAWNEHHAVYPKDLKLLSYPPAQESHRADGPSASGNGAEPHSTRNGDNVARSPRTAATEKPGTSECTPTLQERIGEEAEKQRKQLQQLVASQANVRKQLEELAALKQKQLLSLEERQRQLLVEQEKLDKDYLAKKEQLEQEKAALQGRRQQVDLQLSELFGVESPAQQVHVDEDESDSSQQADSNIAGGAEVHEDDVGHRDAVSIASDSEEDVPLKCRRRSRADIINSHNKVSPDPAERHSPKSQKRGPPAAPCSASNSHNDNTPSAAFHIPSPKKPRIVRQSYAAKRFAERVPDNRGSSFFFRKLGLDKCTVLSRARDMRADPRSSGVVQWRMDLYWTYNPSAPAAERFNESDYAETEASWEIMLIQKGVLQLKDLPQAKYREEYYSVGTKAVKKDIKGFQEVRSKYAQALGVSASKPREKNKYKDIPRAELFPPKP